MCNFVPGDKAKWALSPETKFHIQKYDGLENIEKRSPPLEVTMGSSTETNLGHIRIITEKIKKTDGYGVSLAIYCRIACPLEGVGPR